MREDQHVLNRTGELLLGFVNLSTVWRTSENYTLSRDNNKLLEAFSVLYIVLAYGNVIPVLLARTLLT